MTTTRSADAAKTAVRQSVDSVRMAERFEIGLIVALKDLPEPNRDAFLRLVKKMGEATLLLRDIELMRDEGDQKGCEALERVIKDLNSSRATILSQMKSISPAGSGTVKELLINSGEDIPADDACGKQ